MTTYLLWYDDTPKRPLAEKVGDALERYLARTGQRADICLVHTGDLTSLLVLPEYPTLEIQAERRVRPNTVQVGNRHILGLLALQPAPAAVPPLPPSTKKRRRESVQPSVLLPINPLGWVLGSERAALHGDVSHLVFVESVIQPQPNPQDSVPPYLRSPQGDAAVKDDGDLGRPVGILAKDKLRSRQWRVRQAIKNGDDTFLRRWATDTDEEKRLVVAQAELSDRLGDVVLALCADPHPIVRAAALSHRPPVS